MTESGIFLSPQRTGPTPTATIHTIHLSWTIDLKRLLDVKMENLIKAAKNGRFGNKINVFLVLLRSEQLFETCGIELCYENNSARERLFSSAVNFKRKSRRTNEPVLTVANQAGR